MKVSQYKNFKKAMVFFMAMLIGVAVTLKSALIVLLAMGIYMVLITLLRTRVEGVLADERERNAGERAAQVSFQILLPILAMTSLVLVIGGGEEFYYVQAVGIILSYVTCLGLILYALAYWYFDRKTGGK